MTLVVVDESDRERGSTPADELVMGIANNTSVGSASTPTFAAALFRALLCFLLVPNRAADLRRRPLACRAALPTDAAEWPLTTGAAAYAQAGTGELGLGFERRNVPPDDRAQTGYDGHFPGKFLKIS